MFLLRCRYAYRCWYRQTVTDKKTLNEKAILWNRICFLSITRRNALSKGISNYQNIQNKFLFFVEYPVQQQIFHFPRLFTLEQTHPFNLLLFPFIQFYIWTNKDWKQTKLREMLSREFIFALDLRNIQNLWGYLIDGMHFIHKGPFCVT